MSTKKKATPEVVVTNPDSEEVLSPQHRPRRPQFVLPSTLVELTISAQNLVDRDKLSRSDPICAVYVTKPHRKNWVEYARTEVLENTFSPQWNTKISIRYNFEERQSLLFKIYDWDKETSSWKDQDFLGMLDCALGEIVAAPNKRFVRKLAIPHMILGQSDVPSTITIVVEEISEKEGKDVVGFRLSCTNLINRGVLSKHDPYLIISKQLEDGSWTVVHKTEVLENTKNPNWRFFSVRMSSLGGKHENTVLRWSVLYWSHHGPPKLVGEFLTTFQQAMQAFQDGKASFPLINLRKKEKNQSYTNSGLLQIQELRVDEKKTFVDYLQSGLQLQWTVVIDFSSHNKSLKSPTSYHYIDGEQENRYVAAIKAVGDVLQDYDADKRFPAFAFGAKPTKDEMINQYFPLNYNSDNPACEGVDGILAAYHEALKKVTISTPAIFSESIKQTAKLAKSNQNGTKYFVLLMITRGIINDKTLTIETIINASGLPMSVIIICVGDNNFESMAELDSDGRLLQLNGKKAQRDIVQAVDFKKFMSASRDQRGSKQPYVRKRALAAEVLAELPYQVVNWMESFRPMEPSAGE
ncbi:copine-9 [Folsomia candida]|uniref:copine-9 n=1 Tax=Folsomia candida TaxID=158441 RepID=UPI000B901F21|nr:copine-9 [Folsomia candida]